MFLVGAARSGTTILAKILNSHPKILMTDETAVFLALSGLIEKSREGVSAGLWYGKTYNVLWADFLQEKARDLVLGFYERVAREQGRQDLAFWGDKHPHYCNCLEFIYHCFPNARFIRLIRDPRDVATSIAEMNQWSLEEGIRATAIFLDEYESFFLGHRGLPVFELKYEDMVRNYTETTGKLLAWLGLGMAPEVANFISENAGPNAHTAMTEDVPIRNFATSVQRWRKVFDSTHEMLAMEIFGRYLERYGYL